MNACKFLVIFLMAGLFAGNAMAQVKKTPVKPRTATVRKTAAKEVVSDVRVDKSVRVKIVTDSGIIIVKLYDSTPLHRDNFVKLVNEHFYDSLLFHRVIQNFMIQGGDPLSKNAQPGAPLGMGGGDMTRIPAEFRSSLIHKKGALAAARDGNPEKASSACQFYIVQGKPASDPELDMIEKSNGIKYTAAQRSIYKTKGGTPFLDNNYTVFGEVESGLEVVDKIASVAKAPGDRPIGDVRMHMEIIK